MSARTEHPHAQVLRWVADGFDVESRCDFGTDKHGARVTTDWRVTEPDSVLCYLATENFGQPGKWEFRLAPAQPAQIEFLPALTKYMGVQS